MRLRPAIVTLILPVGQPIDPDFATIRPWKTCGARMLVKHRSAAGKGQESRPIQRPV
jgi:hypothetical protein